MFNAIFSSSLGDCWENLNNPYLYATELVIGLPITEDAGYPSLVQPVTWLVFWFLCI